MWATWGSEQQEELRHEVTYHTYLASGVGGGGGGGGVTVIHIKR